LLLYDDSRVVKQPFYGRPTGLGTANQPDLTSPKPAAMAEAVSDHDRNSEMTSSAADMRAASMISRAHNR
jgi:hypothetical protein